MAELYPIEFSKLLVRLQHELDVGGNVYSLAQRDIWTPDPGVDLSCNHIAGSLGNPLGPASGPHTQMAQNIVLAWLAGARFMELKTVQVMDELKIPRPCIYAPNIGFNVEWSQELKIPQSAKEYAKAWWMVHFLKQTNPGSRWPGGSGDTIFDLSVGYDLAGIQSPTMAKYIGQMKDASSLLSGLRDELKRDLGADADIFTKVRVPERICSSVTLSTFHGCPADEIEGIAAHMLEDHGFHTIIKLNPTLLGYKTVRSILDKNGYSNIEIHEDAFEKDLKWSQMSDFLPRLRKKAEAAGLGFGVKFSNTLVCNAAEAPFTEKEMYLSGPPLHLLAVELSQRFAEHTDFELPISFSAGVDAKNFPGLATAGLLPITTCSDIIKGQGYARLPRYLRNLEKQLSASGHKSLTEVTGSNKKKNLKGLRDAVAEGETYHQKAYAKMPKKVGSSLELLDCLTCDKCIKVCPNMSNISVPSPMGTWELNTVTWKDDVRTEEPGPNLTIDKPRQIGNVVDLCNECGQCDPWCPEDGGPYIVKPHLFLSATAYNDKTELDGFWMETKSKTRWRRNGKELALTHEGEKHIYSTSEGSVTVENDEAVSSSGTGSLEMRDAKILKIFHDAFRDERRELFT